MRVVGTAGHVDHGKSTLVKALTGINPDRLEEEQKREMTIDLGFAWLSLPDGEQVGIVDVPGHRDFIENMLAGVGGIDAVIFVIAADEGIMPQTREHLAILDILKIKTGVVALTKTDLVDPEWLEMVREEVRKFLIGSILEDAKIIPVSSKTGFGLEDLKLELSMILTAIPKRDSTGHPRMPIDRVFTIAGFGTVVTGTLIDGSLHTGTEIQILPSGVKGRIRGLQTHKQKEETALPGSRCAVNISGVDVDQIKRGDVLVEPNFYEPTQRFDASIDMIKDAIGPIKHGDEIKLFVGTKETIASIRVIGKDEILPGEKGWVQIETIDPVVIRRGDRFVIRRPSPGETLGGGMVDDPHPARRYKRFDVGVLNQFQVQESGSVSDLILKLLSDHHSMTPAELAAQIGAPIEQIETLINTLIEQGMVISLKKEQKNSDGRFILKSLWDEQLTKFLQILSKFHHDNPLKKGIPMEELKTRMNLEPGEFQLLIENLISNNKIHQSGSIIFSSEQVIDLDPAQKKRADSLLEKINQAPLTPPSPKDVIGMIGETTYAFLLGKGDLVQVSDEVVFSQSGMELQKSKLVEFLHKNGQITVAEFRDLVGTSRKYALAFLEYCDLTGLTIREGDFRKLVKKDG